MARVLDLDPATYVPHAVHRGERTWAETNCYTDVVIELLHGMGHEPLAALAFTLGCDWDVDQWTFFKFQPADLEELYGLALFELAPWKPLVQHVHDHVAAGRPILVELDSFFLPDTAGTAYGLAHVKSTVAVNEIDLDQRHMTYFHNQSFHALSGDDFDNVFQTAGLVHDRMLPPYIEFVKAVPGAAPLSGGARVEASLAQLRRQLGRLPPDNPFLAFRGAMERDMDWLLASDLETFHTYSFATLRQYGACFALAAAYLRWLEEEGLDGVSAPAAALDGVSESAKRLQFQLARSMMRKRPLKLDPLDEQARHWEQAMEALRSRFA
jgi:hypothetical protein